MLWGLLVSTTYQSSHLVCQPYHIALERCWYVLIILTYVDQFLLTSPVCYRQYVMSICSSFDYLSYFGLAFRIWSVTVVCHCDLICHSGLSLGCVTLVWSVDVVCRRGLVCHFGLWFGLVCHFGLWFGLVCGLSLWSGLWLWFVNVVCHCYCRLVCHCTL